MVANYGGHSFQGEGWYEEMQLLVNLEALQ